MPTSTNQTPYRRFPNTPNAQPGQGPGKISDPCRARDIVSGVHSGCSISSHIHTHSQFSREQRTSHREERSMLRDGFSLPHPHGHEIFLDIRHGVSSLPSFPLHDGDGSYPPFVHAAVIGIAHTAQESTPL